ncbi:hypothetical protein ACIBG4_17935 [Nonomuraea sp. NPDC050383]|uniref:hypothetical protein n=1 Tax=Nonomuraea sp. NPDC050383 TaxID=3364362 RepID=UPI0037960F5E
MDAPMTCVQCGHPDPVPITRRPRRTRYSCLSCGALFSEALFPRGLFEDAIVDREPPAPAGPDPLSAFMPERMVRWVRERDPATDAPDRVTLARWYKDFDALVAAARSSPQARATVERVSEIPLDRLPARIPAFSQVCGALRATCYDAGLAAARLGGADFVLERVGHVRRWLATAGRSTTWLAAPPAPPPAREEVEALLASRDWHTTDQVKTLFRALFGVDKGPSVTGVRERFGDERVRQALLACLETGARPLREAVAADLDAA